MGYYIPANKPFSCINSSSSSSSSLVQSLNPDVLSLWFWSAWLRDLSRVLISETTSELQQHCLLLKTRLHFFLRSLKTKTQALGLKLRKRCNHGNGSHGRSVWKYAVVRCRWILFHHFLSVDLRCRWVCGFYLSSGGFYLRDATSSCDPVVFLYFLSVSRPKRSSTSGDWWSLRCVLFGLVTLWESTTESFPTLPVSCQIIDVEILVS